MYSTYKNNDAQRRTALKRSVENYRSRVEWVGQNSPGVKFFPLKIDPLSEERPQKKQKKKKKKTNLTNLPTLKVCPFTLALLLLNTTCPVLANSVDPDQLASEEAYWSGSALFVLKYVTFYRKTGSSNLIGWKLEVGVASGILIYLAWQGLNERGHAISTRLNVCPAKTQVSLHIHVVMPKGYKTFFLLNSTEHEIFHADKSLITKHFIFSC